MDAAVFPTAELSASYSVGEFEGLPLRELRRFEVFDSEGRYVRPGGSGSVTVAGEVMPTKKGREENEHVKAVVIHLTDPELQLRIGDAKGNYFYFAKAAGAWYCLKQVLPDYEDWWAEQAAHVTLAGVLERELGSKNPRSFERVLARVVKEANSPSANDFIDRFGPWILQFFGDRASEGEFFTGLKERVSERGAGRAEWALPSDGSRLRDVNRDCTKGNEWACQLLGLPPPQRVAGSGSAKKKKKKATTGGEGGDAAASTGAATDGGDAAATAVKRSTVGVEDTSLPGALDAVKRTFKPVESPLPHAALLDLFTVSAFVDAHGEMALGSSEQLEPSVLQDWVTQKRVPLDYERLLCDLMTFIGNEGKDPSVRLFGGGGKGDEAAAEDEAALAPPAEVEGVAPVAPLGRLRRLATFLGQHTWTEVLRRFLYVLRAELPQDLVRESMLALESFDFGGLEPRTKLVITAFLVRRCAQTKRIHDAVDESLNKVSAIKAEKAQQLKDVRASFAEVLKQPLPVKPEAAPELIALRADVAAREAEAEQARASGTADRAELSKRSREANALRKKADELEEKLQAAFDEVALAPERRDAEVARINDEFEPRLREARNAMRMDPLGQDRYHRTFWHFDATRDTHDIVLVHDPSDGSWSYIDNVEELLSYRHALNVRGLREKRLRSGIDGAVPYVRRFIEEEMEIDAAAKEAGRRRRKDTRESAFGRPRPVDDEGEEKNDNDGAQKDDVLGKMQSHLVKLLQELPAGCLMSADVERLRAQAGKASDGRELAAVLKELEGCMDKGWLGKNWSKVDRQQWIEACDAEDACLPQFALLLYMLEFSLDRFYNPKTGKSERPANRHSNHCAFCSKGGNLLMCESCPQVYHMECLSPPLHHIPRGAWLCPQCDRRPGVRSMPRSSRVTRATVQYNEDALSELNGLGLRNPTRSSRKPVTYAEEEDDGGDGDDGSEEGAPRAKRTREQAKSKGEGDDAGDGEAKNDEESAAPRKEKRARGGKQGGKKDSDEEAVPDEEEDEEEEEEEEEAEEKPSRGRAGKKRGGRKAATRARPAPRRKQPARQAAPSKKRKKYDDEDDDDDEEMELDDSSSDGADIDSDD